MSKENIHQLVDALPYMTKSFVEEFPLALEYLLETLTGIPNVRHENPRSDICGLWSRVVDDYSRSPITSCKRLILS